MSFEKMTFGLTYGIELYSLVQGLNSGAPFPRLKVGFAQQPKGLRRLWFEFDRVFKDFGGSLKLLLSNSKLSKVDPCRRVFDVGLERMAICFICLIELVHLEIKRAKFCPCDIVSRVDCYDLAQKCNGGIAVVFLLGLNGFLVQL